METTFSDGTVTIRPLGPDDAEALFEAAKSSYAELSQHLPWCHADYRIEETREYLALQPGNWEAGTEYSFAIVDAHTGRYLGGVGLNAISRVHMKANLGYWVRSDASGRGIATAATILCARFGIVHLGFNRIEIIVVPSNVGSLRVAEKAGAVREGVLRNRIVLNGNVHDVVIHSIIPQDYERSDASSDSQVANPAVAT